MSLPYLTEHAGFALAPALPPLASIGASAGFHAPPPIYSAAMGDAPDLASLAKRYLDLWQEQLIATAADPDLAEAIARLLVAMMAPSRVVWPDMPSHDRSAPATGAPAGTAAAATPPRQRGDGLDEFARRLAAVEERLAALESGTRRNRKRPAPRPRRRRS